MYEQLEVTGLIASIIMMVLVLMFNAAIKEVIKKFFSNLSKSQINAIFGAIVVVCMALVVWTTVSYGIAEPSKPKKEEKKKSDTEKVVDDILIVKDAVERLIVEKQNKDSVKFANKGSRWVYQIGDKKDNLNSLWESYKALEGVVDNLKVFKQSRKEFIIIVDNGLSQADLEESRELFYEKISKLTTHIEVIDLKDYCKIRHDIKETKGIRIRKAKRDLPTIECG